jgi:RES domain-containing protein
VAVHVGFRVLDTTPYVLTALDVSEPANVYVVEPAAVPNPNWLVPGDPSAGQQAFGDQLLARHKFVLLPSAVSTHSWNLVFVGDNATGAFRIKLQERFALDTRLHPAG